MKEMCERRGLLCERMGKMSERFNVKWWKSEKERKGEEAKWRKSELVVREGFPEHEAVILDRVPP